MKFAVRLFTFCINSKSERRVPIVPGAGVWGAASATSSYSRGIPMRLSREKMERAERNSNIDSLVTERTKGACLTSQKN